MRLILLISALYLEVHPHPLQQTGLSVARRAMYNEMKKD